MADLERLLERLRRDPTFGPNVTAWRRREGRPARYGETPAWLDPRLQEALRAGGIERLYTHQVAALQAVRQGEHTVVASGTASGKSLCHHLPVLQALLEDPSDCALYLFPTKALAHDQEAVLRALVERIPDLPDSAKPFPASYDGDTPGQARRAIRERVRIVLSNPDMLHAGILPSHPHWAPFLHHLRYVILDELHTYRGLFGSHIANLLRRLRRVCAFYGSRPQFLCASATIANPGDLAGRLIGEPATVIEEDGAPRGPMHLLLYNPPLLDPALGIRRSALQEARRLAVRLIGAGLQTVVFGRSRRGVELLLTYLRQDLPPGLRPALRGYRGGYLPALRREIEAGLRSGEVRGVVATNALELGVDIGTLAACIMAGYPGSIASTWQQAGRAGRRDQPGLAVLVAGANPLDQYLVTHPDYFFGRSPEQARINPDNPFILAAHLRCSAFELALEDGAPWGTPAPPDLLEDLVREGSLLHEGGRYYWIGVGSPAREVSLRTASGDTVTIIEESSDGIGTIGQVDRPGAAMLVHEQAVYIHEGTFYRVERLDWEAGLAYVRPAQVDYYTQAHLRVDWRVLSEEAQAPQGRGSRHTGEVEVHAQATAYRRVHLHTQESLGWGAISLPPQEFRTQAFWLTLPWPAQEHLRPDYGPNWEEQRRRARERDRFTCRHCGAREEVAGREHDVHHLRPFRTFGYIPGENDAYLEANRLENLVTLCRVCHARVDHGPRQETVAALQGLGHLLAHVAPLYLLCDRGDIRETTRLRALPEGRPVVLIYDDCPGGAGLSPTLFSCADALLQTARERLQECPCAGGCPSCIGPPEEPARDKVIHILEFLLEEEAPPPGTA